MPSILIDPDLAPEDKEVAERLTEDYDLWAAEFGKIVNKHEQLIPFERNEAQLQLSATLAEQRAAGKPQRVIVLKARQVGISTDVQGRLIHRATTRANHSGLVIAQDKGTGAKLYRMGERFWKCLPSELKPGLLSSRRNHEMRFGDQGVVDTWPNSTYLVDTANELTAGVGGTYLSLHCSEVGLWSDIETKLSGIFPAVPDVPESLIVLESTARGNNYFKEMWDDAVDEKNDYAPFFWAWHQQVEYSLPFANDQERENFERGVGKDRLGEDEPKLIEQHDLSLEQLHWRRHHIMNVLLGKIEKFKQEFPSNPEEAFLSTARSVFDPYLTQQVLIQAAISDPRNPTDKHPGPLRGSLRPTERKLREGKRGRIEVPVGPLWTAREKLRMGEDAGWKVWEKPQDEAQYVIGVDVAGNESGGEMSESDEPAFDAIEIIDHKTRVQVAEFHGRIDPDQLAEQAYLAALWYATTAKPWLAIETTGSWGDPVARKIWLDFQYGGKLYFSQSLDKAADKPRDKLGWDTTRATKPQLEATMTQMLREGSHGIKSRELALELKTHVRTPRGRSGPAAGKFNDRLMAYMIAQEVANLKPFKKKRTGPRRVRKAIGAPDW